MSRFFVGQRVKIVRSSQGMCGRDDDPLIIQNPIGREGVIAGTVSHPNAGFYAYGDYDTSLRLDTGELGMCPSACLEPALSLPQTPTTRSNGVSASGLLTT